jgi:hypothetical protein
MKNINQKIKNYLKKNGIIATPKFIDKGSLKGCIRLYHKTGANFDLWTIELINKLTELGFEDFDCKELTKFSGNGGLFSVFVRNRNLLEKLIT